MDCNRSNIVDWSYETAEDIGLRLIDRLQRCPREPDALVYAARIWSALAIRGWLKTYNRFEISGRKNLPSSGPFVLVANHSSHLDAVALMSALPLRALHGTYSVAARDYFCANRSRVLLASIVANAVFFDRNESAEHSLKLCRELLEDHNGGLIIFPEGTRTVDGRMGLFRRGVGQLLAGTEYPAVPCYLGGTFKSWPKGSRIPRPARVKLSIGEARTYKSVAPDSLGVIRVCADLQNAVIALGALSGAESVRSFSQEAYQ
jgi:1-acyl-sn-glycerol-3-phosphate acyltransferase